MVANKFLVNQNHWELLADQTLLDFNMNEIVTKSDKEVNYLQNWQSDLITLEQEYKEESEKSRLLIQQLKEMDAKMNLKLDLLENEVNEFTVSWFWIVFFIFDWVKNILFILKKSSETELNDEEQFLNDSAWLIEQNLDQEAITEYEQSEIAAKKQKNSSLVKRAFRSFIETYQIVLSVFLFFYVLCSLLLDSFKIKHFNKEKISSFE
jgi:hypothetical protein